MSNLSVSFRGDNDASLEQALDTVFKELQDHLNETHVLSRQLAMLADQDADFNVSVDLSVEIQERCDGMEGLFKELKSVVVEVRGKPLNDAEKKYLKDAEQKAKERKEAEKAEAKRLKAEAKAMPKIKE